MLLYIDPGTGSMFFSLAIGILSVLWFGGKKLFMDIKYKTIGKKKTNEKTIPFVIFSDDKRYWKYFEPVCRELDRRSFDMVYMTQSEDDPVFQANIEHLKAQFIGVGNKAYTKMNFLNATMVLSTTPGLDVNQWKRSEDVKYYVYLPHATNAMTTHRMFGLDFYDSLLASGQYQIELIRKLEEIRKEKPKEITLVGIPYMDEIVERIHNSEEKSNKEICVLLAPSWGESAIFSRFGSEIIEYLVKTGYHIIIRPHPQSFISEADLIEKIMKEWPENEQIEWNRDNDNFEVLNRSDIMISDFSGVVFEFSLAFNKPIICVDTQFDDSQYDSYWLNEPNWSITALPRLGEILKEDNLPLIKEMIDRCLNEQIFEKKRNEVLEEAWVYRGEGANRVADYIERKYSELNYNTEVENVS